MATPDYFWNQKDRYQDALDIHGESPKSMHWLDYRSAAFRYRELVADINFEGKSVLDAGCGMGDLLPYIYAKSVNFKYLGVDINEGFIEIARKRYDGHQFKVLDPFNQKVMGSFDIVLCSGVMNSNTKNWLPGRKQMIKKLFEQAHETVAFNMAGAFKPPSSDRKIAYAKTSDILDFCLTLTPRTILRNHYSSIDFTVVMFK